MPDAPETNPIRILVIEDDAGLGLLMTESLADEGFHVSRVEKGRAAIDWLEEHPADLMLLDYSLPDMSSETLLDTLPAIPFIITTGVGDERVAVAMMKRGARDYLLKDRNFLSLLPGAVNRVLREIATEKRLAQAQKALAQSQASLLKAQQIAHLGSWEWNLEKQEISYSEELIRIFGFDPEDGRSPLERWLQAVHPEDRSWVRRSHMDALAGKASMNLEYRIHRRDGIIRHVHTREELVRNEEGRAIFSRAVTQDITARKLAQEEFFKQRRMLLEAQSIGQLGSWEWEIASGRSLWSEELYRILGEEPHTVEPRFQTVIERTLPQDRLRIQAAVQRALKEKGTFHEPLRIRRKNGELRHLDAQAKVIVDQAGHPMRMVGLVLDITERQRTQEALQLTQFMVDHASQAIVMVDQGGLIHYANEVACRLLDVTEEGLSNRCIWELDRTHSEQSWPLFWEHVKTLGSLIQESTLLSPITLEETSIEFTHTHLTFQENEYIVSYARDITERKRAEAEIVRTLKKLEDLKAAVDVAAPVLTLDRNGTITYINQGLLDLTGFDPEDLLGQPHGILRHEGQPASLWEELAQELEKGNTWKGELNIRTKNGEYAWLESTYVPLMDEGNHPSQTMGIHFDLTARKAAEYQLIRLFAQHQILLQAASVARVVPWSMDPQKGMISMGDSAYKVLGIPAESIHGASRRVLENLLGEEHHLFSKARAEAEAGGTGTFDAPLRKPDGRHIWTRWTLAQSEGALQGVIQDVTESKELQAQLLQSQKLESIGSLASSISHDFNNILMGVLGATEVLQALELPSLAAKQVDVIQRAALRGRNFIAQLMRFSRKQVFSRVQAQLNDIAIEVRDLVNLGTATHICLDLNLDASLPSTLLDPNQMVQVVMNLVVNARDALGEVGGRITLRTGLRKLHLDEARTLGKEAGDYLFLEVEDDGPGIPPEVQTRIFEPFFTTKSSGKGTGLGLSVAHSIVEGHGGLMRCDSQPGCGTRFQVYLPLTNTIPES